VLLIPLVGFLPPDDPRVRGTVEAMLADGLAP
jgi:GH15 family glucan-1,4-alpha-glucosidase